MSASATRNALVDMSNSLARVMAIVNRTPDSFYDKGATFAIEKAAQRADEVIAAGASIVDVGGVKAGPGDEVDVDEEIDRVVPLIAEVRARHPEVSISVDTWRASVAEAAIDAGADLINDTWAGWDPELVEVAGRHAVGYVCLLYTSDAADERYSAAHPPAPRAF